MKLLVSELGVRVGIENALVTCIAIGIPGLASMRLVDPEYDLVGPARVVFAYSSLAGKPFLCLLRTDKHLLLIQPGRDAPRQVSMLSA